jgi:hypothetical protein
VWYTIKLNDKKERHGGEYSMIIPVRKPFALTDLAEQFDFEYGEPKYDISRYLLIYEIHSYSYNLTKKDDAGQIWSVYLYMNNNATTVIGIDNYCSNDTTGSWAEMTLQSPFASLFKALKDFEVSPKFKYLHEIENYPGILEYSWFEFEDKSYRLERIITAATMPMASKPLTGKSYFCSKNNHHITLLGNEGNVIYVETAYSYEDNSLPF